MMEFVKEYPLISVYLILDTILNVAMAYFGFTAWRKVSIDAEQSTEEE